MSQKKRRTRKARPTNRQLANRPAPGARPATPVQDDAPTVAEPAPLVDDTPEPTPVVDGIRADDPDRYEWDVTGFDPADPFTACLVLTGPDAEDHTVDLSPATVKTLHAKLGTILQAQRDFFHDSTTTPAHPGPGQHLHVIDPGRGQDPDPDLDDIAGDGEPSVQPDSLDAEIEGFDTDDAPATVEDTAAEPPDGSAELIADHPWGHQTTQEPGNRARTLARKHITARSGVRRRRWYQRPTVAEKSTWSPWRRHKVFTVVAVVIVVSAVLGFLQVLLERPVGF